MNTLSRSIEDFYRAFASVPSPRHIDGCPCCIENHQISRLLSTPLRELESSDLTSYASSALLTVGDVSDYLYFLPRIIDISIHEESWWPNIEVTARAIHSTNLTMWPPDRLGALFALLSAVMDHILESGAYWKIDEWVCSIARMGIDVRPFLSRMEQNSAAVLRYFDDNAQGLQNGKLGNAFWELPSDGHEVILQWFRSPAVQLILFDAEGDVR